jgi:hypothetical protein
MVVDMTKMMTGWLAVLMALVSSASVLAHHSLANHDTTKAVRVKGTVVQVNLITPHSFFYLEEKTPEGQIRRWAVEGPAGVQLQRRGISTDFLKLGAVIDVCGYVPKEATIWQIASPSGVSLAGRLITAELLVLPDGREQSWSGYGVNKCFAEGHRDQQSK